METGVGHDGVLPITSDIYAVFTVSGGLSLSDGMDLSGLSYEQLWVRYVGVGGSADTRELRHHVNVDSDPYEHNLIASALNEYFLDRDENHPVGYRPDSHYP
jgi:hypothetical protein